MYKAVMSICIMLVAVFGFTRTASAELVGHWAFDETSGGITMDSSGRGHDGVVVDDITWDKGHLDGAVRFTGDGRIDIPAETWDVIERQVTITLWIYGAEDLEGNYAFIASDGGTGINGRKASTHLPHPNGNVYWDAGGGGPGAYDRIFKQVPEEYGKGQWVHWAFVKNADSGQMKIYLNGTLFHQEGGKTNTFTNITTFSIGGWTDGTYQYQGRVDDFQIHNVELTEAEIQQTMKGISRERASAPTPEDAVIDVLRDVTLEWTPGEFVATHNLYWGDSFEDVNEATVPTAAGLDVNSFDPGRLDFGKTYFWRVDEVNGTADKTVFKGHVWSFTAEPYSIQIAGSEIIATASSYSNDFSKSDKTVDGSGLGENETHGIETETMWFTAMGDMDPWIQYEFETVKKLDIMKVWNSNSGAEGFIGYGVKEVQIEYSKDGETWNILEDANEFSRAPGLPTYNQYDEIAFGGAAAKMVRINIQSNFGGFMQAYSLSEVQFSMIPAAARTPEPESGSVDIAPGTELSWRAGREAAQSTVYVSTDPNEVADGIAASATSNTNSIDLSSFDLQMGQTYYWRVDEVNEAEVESVWAGLMWSFSTVATIVVDDFESYGNDSPDRPFQTWLDGFGYSADEFYPAGYGGNGTGAGIGHDIWTVASEHYNGDIMETANTMPDSGQSMPFYYRNSGNVASQTERSFAPAQDWTIAGVKTLSIAFRGQEGNTGTLYVKINNTKLTYPRAATNIALGAWQAWNIDLTSMNVQNVTTLQIGVNGAGASGMILIDDIKLYPTAGELIVPAEPDAAGLVGHWSFDESSGTTAADSSGNNNNGTVVGDAQWSAGKVGNALVFDGVDDMVVVNQNAGLPIYNNGTDNAYSIAMWVKGGPQNDMRIFSEGSTTSGTPLLNLGTQDSGQFATYIRPETGTVSNHPLSQAEPFDDTWHHIAWVDDNGTATLYIDGLADGGNFNYTRGTMALDTTSIGGILRAEPSYFFTGQIDEVRVYNRALSAGEALWLGGVTTPMDKPF